MSVTINSFLSCVFLTKHCNKIQVKIMYINQRIDYNIFTLFSWEMDYTRWMSLDSYFSLCQSHYIDWFWCYIYIFIIEILLVLVYAIEEELFFNVICILMVFLVVISFYVRWITYELWLNWTTNFNSNEMNIYFSIYIQILNIKFFKYFASIITMSKSFLDILDTLFKASNCTVYFTLEFSL